MGITTASAQKVVLAYLGDSAAKTYGKFFKGESTEEIERSLVEILTSLMGAEKAKQKVEEIAKNAQ